MRFEVFTGACNQFILLGMVPCQNDKLTKVTWKLRYYLPCDTIQCMKVSVISIRTIWHSLSLPVTRYLGYRWFTVYIHWLPSNWVGPGVLQMTVTESCDVAVTGLLVCIQLSGSPVSSNWIGGGMIIIAAIAGRLYHQWKYSFLFAPLPIFSLFFFVFLCFGYIRIF